MWIWPVVEKILEEIYKSVILKIEAHGPNILWWIFIFIVWIIIARLLYLILMIFFKKINLNLLVDKLKINLDEENLKEEWDDNKKKIKKVKNNRFTDKIKVDDVVAKAISYYIVIVFLRISISYIWITEIEKFLWDVLAYLPNLFVWLLIWFFGIRFANFVYDVIYHALAITKEKTSKIIASTWKIIILFFTFTIFLDYTKIVSDFIINTIFIGFIAMLSISWRLAFWLWWKDIAKEILESFRK